MNLTILVACAVVVIMYIVVSIFGYLTVVGTPNEALLRATSNILEVDYKGNVWFLISIASLILSIFCCAPMCFLCAKDVFESLYYK